MPNALNGNRDYEKENILSDIRSISVKRIVLHSHRHLKAPFTANNENHPYWIMYIFLKGSCECALEGECDSIESTDFSYCFIPPGLTHSIKSASKEIEYITLMFDMDCPFDKRLINSNTITHRLKPYFNMIIEKMQYKSVYSENQILNLIALIVSETLSFERYNQIVKPFSENSFVRISDMKKKIADLVGENIYNPELNVTFIAKQLYISTSYLYRCCVYNFGVSPSEYINERKLEKACEMITENGYTFSEIAHNLNFCSQSYFSTRFKKKYGITPLKYKSGIEFKK